MYTDLVGVTAHLPSLGVTDAVSAAKRVGYNVSGNETIPDYAWATVKGLLPFSSMSYAYENTNIFI